MGSICQTRSKVLTKGTAAGAELTSMLWLVRPDAWHIKFHPPARKREHALRRCDWPFWVDRPDAAQNVLPRSLKKLCPRTCNHRPLKLVTAPKEALNLKPLVGAHVLQVPVQVLQVTTDSGNSRESFSSTPDLAVPLTLLVMQAAGCHPVAVPLLQSNGGLSASCCVLRVQPGSAGVLQIDVTYLVSVRGQRVLDAVLVCSFGVGIGSGQVGAGGCGQQRLATMPKLHAAQAGIEAEACVTA